MGESKGRSSTSFQSRKGRFFQIFDIRPLNLKIFAYCVHNVFCLLDLFGTYRARFGTDFSVREGRLRAETEKRSEDSVSDAYELHGSDRKVAPECI